MSKLSTTTRPRADEGMSLVEVVVALFVFALVSTGIIASTTMVIRMTSDDRAREVAVNLAEQQLDGIRATINPFNVHGSTTTKVVSGRTYTVTTTASWVSQSGGDVTCGSSTNFYYKRVGVKVSWVGMLATTSPVHTDSIIAPDGRINDASTGSIAVQLTAADGSTGATGATVTVTPLSGGAAALQSQPANTDSDGCTAALSVTPGTYKVVVSRANSLDPTQSATLTSTTVTVTAGATYSLSWTYDFSGAYALTYANNVTSTPVPFVPTNLDTTFLSTGAPYFTHSPSSTVALFPFTSGYTAIAGVTTTASGSTICASEDPAAWPAGTSNGVALSAGTRTAGAYAAPGATATLGVAMGAATVKSTAATALYLTAVQATPTGTGNPGCTTSVQYTFGKVLAANITPLTNAAPGGVSTLGVLTLDPRKP